MKKAIIIFVRNPELGKVKTRLAKGIGEESALRVYKNLLKHTHEVIKEVACDKFVFYVDAINHNDLWENDIFNKMQQKGNDLGERMYHAFQVLFEKGYEKILIIGSDCPQLQTSIIEDAFMNLTQNDLVIGSTFDGGYYLLGMKKLNPAYFEHKVWSTETVYEDTIRDVTNLQLRYYSLPQLSDIDTIEDWLPFKDIL